MESLAGCPFPSEALEFNENQSNHRLFSQLSGKDSQGDLMEDRETGLGMGMVVTKLWYWLEETQHLTNITTASFKKAPDLWKVIRRAHTQTE